MMQRSFGHRALGNFVFFPVALLFGCSVASGQSTTGTVLGTVKDTSGAIVSGAVVKLLNAGTNASRSTITSDSGAFQFLSLDVGTYQLDITAVGFEQVRFGPVELGARETKRIDADLKVASQTTTVDVESSAGALGRHQRVDCAARIRF